MFEYVLTKNSIFAKLIINRFQIKYLWILRQTKVKALQ